MRDGRHGAKGTVEAWDLPTRLFKWMLVLLVAMAWLSDKYGVATPEWHKWNGYTILVLIVFRLLWGFFGGVTARFSSFFPTPQRIFGYCGALVQGRKLPYLGHNPLGACMVLLLLAAVFCQAVLGLYSADPDRLVIEGPLSGTLSDASVDEASHVHRLGFDFLLILIGLHVLANLAYDLIGKEGMIRAMVVGRKPAALYADMPRSAPGSLWLAFTCLIAAVILVFGGIFLLGGRSL